MKDKSLKVRIESFLERNGAWVHSGELQRIVAKHTSYMPATVARRLRELEEEGKVLVRYEHGSALYKTAPNILTTTISGSFFDSYRKA